MSSGSGLPSRISRNERLSTTRSGSFDGSFPLHEVAPERRRLPPSKQFPDLIRVEAEHNLPALDEQRSPDQVRILRHQLDRLLAGWRIGLHAPLPVQFVARVEEQLVVALADQGVKDGWAQSLVQVDLLGLDTVLAQETPGVAAGGSGGFAPEINQIHGDVSSSIG